MRRKPRSLHSKLLASWGRNGSAPEAVVLTEFMQRAAVGVLQQEGIKVREKQTISR